MEKADGLLLEFILIKELSMELTQDCTSMNRLWTKYKNLSMQSICSKMWMRKYHLSMINNNQHKIKELKLILILQKWKLLSRSSKKLKKLMKIMKKIWKMNNMKIVWWMKINTLILLIAFNLKNISMILKMKISEWFYFN